MVSALECSTIIYQLEYCIFATLAYTPKLDLQFEVPDSLIIWLGISSIEEVTAHPVPPTSMPVCFAGWWVLTVVSMHENTRLFGSNNSAVFLKDSFCECQAREDVRANH
jgi:hypothetical protein